MSSEEQWPKMTVTFYGTNSFPAYSTITVHAPHYWMPGKKPGQAEVCIESDEFWFLDICIIPSRIEVVHETR